MTAIDTDRPDWRVVWAGTLDVVRPFLDFAAVSTAAYGALGGIGALIWDLPARTAASWLTGGKPTTWLFGSEPVTPEYVEALAILLLFCLFMVALSVWAAVGEPRGRQLSTVLAGTGAVALVLVVTPVVAIIWCAALLLMRTVVAAVCRHLLAVRARPGTEVPWIMSELERAEASAAKARAVDTAPVIAAAHLTPGGDVGVPTNGEPAGRFWVRASDLPAYVGAALWHDPASMFPPPAPRRPGRGVGADRGREGHERGHRTEVCRRRHGLLHRT